MEETRMETVECLHFGEIPKISRLSYNYSTSPVVDKGTHAEIDLGDRVALIDSNVISLVKGRKWHYTESNGVISNKRWYERTKHKRGHYKLHRIVTNAPDGKVVDHINGDRLDNRSENLRVVTQSDNLVNTISRPMRNIEFSMGSYCVRLRYKNKRHYFGRYKSLEEAIKVRDEAAEKIHGDLRRR